MTIEENFTQEELAKMKAYESRTGKRIIYTFEEKCEKYRTQTRPILEDLARQTALDRFSILIGDYSGPDNSWINKQLLEDLNAIIKVIGEKNGK